MKQSHLNRVNARIVNQNLTRSAHKKSSKDKVKDLSKTKDSLPLADVRLMADKKAKDSSIPFGVSQRDPFEFNDNMRSVSGHGRLPDPDKTGYGRLGDVDPGKTEDDSEDVAIDSDLGVEEDEEEKVRRKTSFPTILMPRPKRKPPFTIEGAMSSILRRGRKKEPPAEPEEEAQNNIPETEINIEDKAPTPKTKKRTSFNFSKLKVNLINNNQSDDNNANIFTNADVIENNNDTVGAPSEVKPNIR